MARISGKDLYVIFGSTDLSTDYQSFEDNREGKVVELTAGDDANATYAASYADGTASFTGLYDATNGSVVWAAVLPTTAGTLVWAPKGSTSQYPKYTVPVIVSSASMSFPFDGAIEVSVEWQFNGAVTPGTIT